MTNIDHDALARRITDKLHSAMRVSRHGYWSRGDAEECIANVLREALPTSDACEWTQQGDPDCLDWLSDCGKEFRLEDGWPSSNGMKHCCFCGKKIIDVPFEESFDEPEDDES